MKYLLYTEVPLDGEYVQQRLAALDRSATLMVLVPTPPLSAGERTFVETEHAVGQYEKAPEAMFAGWRLRQAIECMEQAGFAEVDGDAIAMSPVKAIETMVENGAYDAVVVVTEPAGVAGWVHLDLAHRIERHVDQPVIHIEPELAH